MQRLVAKRALTELEQLGAKVARSEVAGGRVLDEPVLSVEVGEAFHGEDADLRRLKWIIDVPILILSGKRVNDGWVKEGAAMAGLNELHLYQARISDAGLSPLADHPNLKQLGLYYTPVSDPVLAPLAKAPLLSFVKLYGTQVTKEGEEKLKAASGVYVDYRRGAFLGVQGSDTGDTCPISTAHPGSPAEKAGLQHDDVIVRFGKDAVTNFSSLTELISRCNAGDEVEIEVARQIFEEQGTPSRRTVTVKVTLAAWEMEAAVKNQRPR
jgi:hypothetical protein